MTSRLKKRLDNLGVDAHSARANENFCLIGTPLPPLEKSKDTGEFVRDEKGRRRLHGAFTGGFSAGYFNTVGSKEGWTPSTFVSSRGDRSKKKTARPEDFMDEEDLQDLRESRNLVDTTEEMDLTKATSLGQGDDEQDSVARALEASMLPTAKDSAGARILKKMGWRIGQGIGPRVTLRQRKLQDLVASGRRFTEADLVIQEEEEEAQKHTYAPRDISVLAMERKDNTHGLGYRPGMSLNEGNANAPVAGPKLAGGFGLGALNDADEDDLDVYEPGSTAQNRNRTAYDIIDREEEEKISIGSKADRAASSRVGPAPPSHAFQDGRAVLPGFVLASSPVSEDRWFPPPEVPQGWKADPRRVWNNESLEKQPEVPPQSSSGRNKFSADQRGSMLGETPLPSAPRSVFEYMSQKDRERIQNISSNAELPSLSQEPGPPPPPTAIRIPRTEPHIALAALNGGFVPFATNPAKQARYTAYLQSQTDSPGPPPQPLPGQPLDEYNKELEDYAKAAVIFKPLSGAMAGRFTSAVVVEHGPQITEGLYMPSKEDLEKKEEELKKEREEKVSPKVHAARLGMYGPMTRETQSWQPARLLCKRFKVKDPEPTTEMQADEQGSGFGQPSTSAGVWDQVSAAAGVGSASDSIGNSTSTPTGNLSSGPRDLANIGLGEDETQGRDTLTYQRPAMDVFKAIFASDDEDSDDDAEKAEVDDPTPPAPPEITMAPATETSVVDMNTFKPTFIPRDGKAKKESERTKEKKEKKKKDKDRKTLVSFTEEGESLHIIPNRPKKKRRKEKELEEDESMWVEKPIPDVLKEHDVVTTTADGLPKGRKRAIDFM